MPALLDMLRRSIFGHYPTSFLGSASGFASICGAQWEREGWIEQNSVNCDLRHTPFSRTAPT